MTNHVVNNLVDFTNRELQNKVYSLVLAIARLYVLHGGICFLLVPSSFYTAVACYGVFLLHHSKTHDLVTIVHKLVDQPLQRIRRVLVLVETA